MTLQRPSYAPRRARRRWLPFAIVAATAAIVASSAVILLTPEPQRPAQREIYLTVDKRMHRVDCPSTRSDSGSREWEDAFGARMRTICHHEQRHGPRWRSLTRLAGTDDTFYTADDTCWMSNESTCAPRFE